MLVNAMEVSGIEGSYRSTCEAVMRVLRLHRDSVMAMLEAFVHDPLINWRLLTNAAPAAAAARAADKEPAPAPPAGRDEFASGTAAATAAAAAVLPAAAAAVAPPRTSPPHAAAAVAADAEARSLVVLQGMAFAAAIEAADVQQGGLGAGAPGVPATAAAAAAPPTAAIARSLAASMHGAGARERAAALGAEGGGGAAPATEALNERAVAVIRRIQAKLAGKDFADPVGRLMSAGVGPSPIHAATGRYAAADASAAAAAAAAAAQAQALADPADALDVPAQVHRLIAAATSHENLSQSYAGWCASW